MHGQVKPKGATQEGKEEEADGRLGHRNLYLQSKRSRSPAGAPDLSPRYGDAQISVFVAVSASVSSPGRAHTGAPGLNSFFLRLCCHPVANPAMAPGACGAQRQRPGHPWAWEGAPHGQCPMVSAMVSVMVTAEVSAEVSTP